MKNLLPLLGLIGVTVLTANYIYPLRGKGTVRIILPAQSNQPPASAPGPGQNPPPSIAAAPPTTPAPTNDPECKSVRDHSVAKIQAGREIGTGSVIAPGILLTNNHVVEKANGTVKVDFMTGESFSGTVIATAPMEQGDMGLIKLQGDTSKLPVIPMEDKSPTSGDVVAIGTPYGEAGVITTGKISSVEDGDVHHTATLKPGNSGGPLLIGGKCTYVGLNKGVIPETGDNLATTVEVAKRFVNENISKGR